MATVTGLTADRMLAIEAASITDARMDGANLILINHAGVEFNLGPIKAEVPKIPPPIPGCIYMEAFDGATDDDKMQAAMTFAKAQIQIPSIILPGRDVYLNRTIYTYSAMRILGPGIGWQNPEISGTSAKLVPGRIVLGPDIGIEAASLFVGIATTYDVLLRGITFYGTNVQEVYHHDYESAGTCYAARFDSLTFSSVKHALGSPAQGFSITLCHFTGEWTNVGVTDTQYTLRGSDNWLWTSGVLNYGWKAYDVSADGKYLFVLSNMMKTKVANLYLTARGGKRCLFIGGTSAHQGGLVIRDCVFEGQNLNDPGYGALIKQVGGYSTIRDSSVNFYMSSPATYTDAKDKAAIEVSGGSMLIDGIFIAKAANVLDTMPVASVYKTGKIRARNWVGVKGSSVNYWAQLPIIRQAFAGQASVDDSIQLILPEYLRRTTGVGPGSQAVTIANSAPGGTAWDEISAPAPATVRYSGNGTEVYFAQAGGTVKSYLAWTDMEGATKKASIRSWFYFQGLPTSPQPLWQFIAPSALATYVGITVNNFGKMGYSNDITGTANSIGTTALALNTWYIMHAEVDGGTTDSNGTLNVEVQDATGVPIAGAGFSVTGQNFGASNVDVIMGSARFGRLGAYGTVPDFRMKNFAFQVNTNTVIPAP